MTTPFRLLLLVAVTLSTLLNVGYATLRQFKVMTLNAYNYVDGPNWDERVLGIREMVLNNDPDCVAFEEVRIIDGDRSMYKDLKEHLKDKYPSWKYGKASMFSISEEEGVAIACKWAMHSSSVATMERIWYCSDPLTRAVVHMSVAVGKESLDGVNVTSADLVDIYATHWSYSECNQDMNAMKTLKFVNKTSVGKSAFILGDFNAHKETSTALLTVETVPVHLGKNFSTTYRMKDSWRALYPDVGAYPGYTFSSIKNNRGGLHNRCDRIFYSGEAVPLNAEVICENPGKELIPSDHCAYSFTAAVPHIKELPVFDVKRDGIGGLSSRNVYTVMVLINVAVVALFLYTFVKRRKRTSYR